MSWKKVCCVDGRRRKYDSKLILCLGPWVVGFGLPVEDVVHLAESLLQHLLSSPPKLAGAGNAAGAAAAAGKPGKGRKRNTDRAATASESVRALCRSGSVPGCASRSSAQLAVR